MVRPQNVLILADIRRLLILVSDLDAGRRTDILKVLEMVIEALYFLGDAL